MVGVVAGAIGRGPSAARGTIGWWLLVGPRTTSCWTTFENREWRDATATIERRARGRAGADRSGVAL